MTIKDYTFEVRGYSPTSYDFYHLGVVEGRGTNLEEAAKDAWSRYVGARTFGAEPVSMVVVVVADKVQHAWAKGYR